MLLSPIAPRPPETPRAGRTQDTWATVTENDLHFDHEGGEIDSNNTQGGCQLRDGDAAGIDAAIPGCDPGCLYRLPL